MSKKLFVGFAVVALLLGVSVTSASAQSVADLQAQIQALLGQISQLQGSPVAGGGSSVTAPMPPLSVGSKGAEVTSLQNWLISQGYSIPAGATGYFGEQTRSALAKWQADHGVTPASGYYGSITYSAVMALGGGSTGTGSGSGSGSGSGALCPNGNTLASNCSMAPGQTQQQLCPNGNTLASNCMTAPGQAGTPSGVTSGTDGSVTIASSAVVSTGTSVKKGETKDVLSTRLQATSGPVSVNRVEIKFSERPWLTLSKVQLKSGTGSVLATKTLSSSADATEVTVGSDYRVRFDGVNLTVDPSTDVDLVVSVTVLASSDKITGQTVTISIPSGGIRTTNGINFSETIGPSASFTYTLPTSGSVADIYTSISSNSPLAGIQQIAAGTTKTENVVLAKYRIKAQNTSATLNSLSFNFKNSTGVATSTLFSNVRLASGSLNYGAAGLAAGDTTFTNMQVPLPLDQWVDFTLTADVAGADSSSGVSASTTLVASSISGIDANFNSLTVSNASNVTSADRTFLQNGVSVSSASATAGSPNNADAPTTFGVTYTFTLNNVGNNTVYISKTPGRVFATTTVPSSNATSTLTILDSIAINGSSEQTEHSQDTSASFAIDSGGSRTFRTTGVIGKTAGGTGPHQLKITAIYFGSSSTAGTQGQDSTNAANNTTTGLGSLSQSVNF